MLICFVASFDIPRNAPSKATRQWCEEMRNTKVIAGDVSHESFLLIEPLLKYLASSLSPESITKQTVAYWVSVMPSANRRGEKTQLPKILDLQLSTELWLLSGSIFPSTGTYQTLLPSLLCFELSRVI